MILEKEPAYAVGPGLVFQIKRYQNLVLLISKIHLIFLFNDTQFVVLHQYNILAIDTALSNQGLLVVWHV